MRKNRVECLGEKEQELRLKDRDLGDAKRLIPWLSEIASESEPCSNTSKQDSNPSRRECIDS